MTQITNAQTPEELAAIWDRSHISNKFPSNVRHKDLKNYIAKLKQLGIKTDEVGKSVANREIYQIEWGSGPTKVFLWSQMHGNEPTATSALIDMFAFLQENRGKIAWVDKLEKTLTIRAIPMLNPDGADMYRRRNLQGIDINRDARNLETPEAALLMKLRNQFMPEIGFNLHNQNELTTIGETTNQAAISVLAVRPRPGAKLSEGQHRNTRITSLIISALNKFIPGYIGRYDDSYTESAFGDTFSDLGTPVILIETGALNGKDELYLVRLNFVAFLTALQSIANGSEANADPVIYENLPENSGGNLYDYIFRNASVVNFEEVKKEEKAENEAANNKVSEKKELIYKSFEGDVGVNKLRRREEIKSPPMIIRRVGKMEKQKGLKEYDVSGYYVFTRTGAAKRGKAAALLFYKKSRKIDWNAKNFEKTFPPDAIFYRGKWLKGGELFK